MENNNDKKIKIYITLLITVVCIIGVSYAYFRLVLSQKDNNSLASRTCFSTTLTEQTSKIALTDVYPVTDEEGIKGTPYTFTIKNNCTGYVKATITIDSEYRTQTSTTYLNDNYVKVNLSKSDVLTQGNMHLGKQELVDLDNSRKGYKLLEIKMGPNQEFTYDLRLWLDADTNIEQGLNKRWEGKIVVATVAIKDPATPNGWNEAAEGTLLASLRKNTEISDPITIPGKEVNAHTLDDAPSQTESVLTTEQKYYITYGTGWEANGTKFNLTGASVTSDTYANSYSSLVGKYLIPGLGSSTAGEMQTTTDLDCVYYVVSATQNSFTYKQITSVKNVSEAIVASTEDDYGTSYYFRGAVTNNYVQFANKCWRIVRVGGDGSVKLILHNDNTAGAANPCASANNSASAAFARYSGTTYTSAFNTNKDDNAYVGFMYGTPGSSTYAATHAITNKSTILINLETWYNDNLKTYESVIDNSVWCNDKTNVTDTTYNPRNMSNVTGLGYAKNVTYYGATQRLVSTSGSAGGTGPSLKCNGKLSKITSKIGLITADELAFAGYAGGLGNTTTYLQENATDAWWWSLSPGTFSDGYACVWIVFGSAGAFINNDVSNAIAVRPSLSLKSTVPIASGKGTRTSPYVVE